jgi:hypothetical protein
MTAQPGGPGPGRPAGLWLIYLVFAVALDFILKYTLPV